MRPYRLVAAAAAVMTGLLQSGSANALGPCEERDNLIATLAERYREAPIALGVTNGGSLVEVLKNTTSETWTIIVTSPQGISCLVFSGDGWREQRHVTLPPGA